MKPNVGPVAFRVRGFEAGVGAGLTVGPITFRWPRPLFVTSLLLVPRSGLRADMAKLRIQIDDETQQQIILSGEGSNNYGGALSLSGLVTLAPMFSGIVMVAPMPIQRPVACGDNWRITIENLGGATIYPELSFGFEEGVIAA